VRNVIAKAGAPGVETPTCAKKFFCPPCVAAYVEQHAAVLRGQIVAEDVRGVAGLTDIRASLFGGPNLVQRQRWLF